jgi:small subunit ribosomal protein S3Ae
LFVAFVADLLLRLFSRSLSYPNFAGYILRLFCIAFTAKMQGQQKKTCYAQSAQIRNIRKKMVDIMMEEASSEDLKGLIQKL